MVDYPVLNSFAYSFQAYCETYKCQPSALAESLVPNQFFLEYPEAFDIYGRGYPCIAQIMYEYLTRDNVVPAVSEEYIESDVAFWLGYLLMYWYMLEQDVSIIVKVDFERVCEFYDVLHMESIEGCIEEVKLDFLRRDLAAE